MTRYTATSILLALSTATTIDVSAQVLVVDSLRGVVALLDRADGRILDPAFIDLSLALGQDDFSARKAVSWNDEVLVLTGTVPLYHRFSADGQTYLGSSTTNGARGSGACVAHGAFWTANSTPTSSGMVYERDPTTGAQLSTIPNLSQANDVLGHTLAGVPGLLISFEDRIEFYDPATGARSLFYGGVPDEPIGVPAYMTHARNGNVVVGAPGGTVAGMPAGVFEFSPDGQLVFQATFEMIGVPRVLGAVRLDNGTYLVTSSWNPTEPGLFIYDPVTSSHIEVLPSTICYGISLLDDTRIGSTYCMGAPNSTGQLAELLVQGSPVLADDLLSLRARALPPGQTTLFLVGQLQGFIANPRGSLGNLCLGGTIGAFSRQVRLADPAGIVEINVDLMSLPQSTGAVVVQPGETWQFQAWYRDSIPAVTNNFTSASSITFQ